MRVLVTKSTSPARAVGIKEVQVFDTGTQTQTPGGVGGTVPATLVADARRSGELRHVHRRAREDYTASTTANVISTAGDAALSVADPSATARATWSTARSRCRSRCRSGRATRPTRTRRSRRSAPARWACSATRRRSAKTP